MKMSVGYMIFSAILSIILGFIMLFYPGGTMALMQAAFMILQIILSIFVVYYTTSMAVYSFKKGHKASGVLYIIFGITATVLVWLFHVGIVYLLVAAFLILAGIGDIIAGFKIEWGKYFLIFLGFVNILIAIIILRYPVVLPLLIAWYILFWGISRFLLALQLRKIMAK